MATRVYFNSNVAGTPAVTPSSWSAGWNKTSGTAVDAAVILGSGVLSQGDSSNAASGTSGHFTAIRRFVSPPLAAQTISGTVKGQVRTNEVNATDNYTFAFALKVIKTDGTDRGVLVGTSASDDTSATPPELAVTTATNRQWLDASESASVSLSSLGVSYGDRIVVEVGFRQASTSVASGRVFFRTAIGATDLPEDNSTTTLATNSWLEFSNTLQFAAGYVGSSATPVGFDSAATGVADPTVVTPPTGMLAGDLVVMVGHQRATGATLAVSADGGQSWSSLTAIGTTNVTARVFWCVFNGTWGANPSVDFSATTCNSVQLHVFRPGATTSTWSVNVAQVELDIAAGTGVHTITGQTTTGTDPTVTLAGWFTADDNQWDSISGTGWQTPGEQWYANTSGSDQSSAYAYRIQTAAGATGNVSKTQSANGPDAATSFIVTFAATLPSTAKTLTADTVAFSFTGDTTTALELGRELVPEAGSYSFSGSDANFRKGLIVVPEAGSYSFAGQEVTLDRTFKLIPEAGNYSFAGQTASLEYGREIAAEATSYSFAGQDASLEHGWEVLAEATSYSFAGSEVTLDRTYRLIVETGSFAFAGSDATLTHTTVELVLPADAGSFSFAGQTASLEHGWELLAEATSYSFAGQAASLEHGWEILAETVAFSFSGTAASLEHGWEVLAEATSYAFAGQDVTLDRTFRVIVEAGAYSFAGQDITLDRTYRLIAEATSYSFAGQDVTLDRTYRLIAEAGSYAYTGSEASLVHEAAGQTILGAGPGSFQFSGSDANLEHGWELSAEAGSFSFTGSDATLTVLAARTLAAEAGSYVFTGSDATLTYVPTAPIAPATTWGGEGAEFWVRKWREQAQALKPVVVKPFAEVVNEQAPAQHVIPARDDRRPDPEFTEFTDFIRLLEKL